jgi:hypothetical protein
LILVLPIILPDRLFCVCDAFSTACFFFSGEYPVRSWLLGFTFCTVDVDGDDVPISLESQWPSKFPPPPYLPEDPDEDELPDDESELHDEAELPDEDEEELATAAALAPRGGAVSGGSPSQSRTPAPCLQTVHLL